MIEKLAIDELKKLWPKDESGALAARLLQRYFFSLGIETALAAECTEVRAQAEASANKTIAKIVTDFSTLTVTPDRETPKPRMAQLKRFENEKPTTPEKL